MQKFEALSWTCFTDELWSTVCVQKSSVSQNSARHTAFRSKLRPSSSKSQTSIARSRKIDKVVQNRQTVQCRNHHSQIQLKQSSFTWVARKDELHIAYWCDGTARNHRVELASTDSTYADVTNNRNIVPGATNAYCFKLHDPSRRRRLNRSSTEKTEKSKILFGSFTDWDKVISTIEYE